MRHRITPAVVAAIERRLAAGRTPAAIAARMRVSAYVVRVIAHDQPRPRGRPHHDRRRTRRVSRARRALAPETVRRIQRMLSVGILSPVEIAREAGVGHHTVADIAQGRRLAVALTPPALLDGERWMPTPVRCAGCGALVYIVPCRACAARTGDVTS